MAAYPDPTDASALLFPSLPYYVPGQAAPDAFPDDASTAGGYSSSEAEESNPSEDDPNLNVPDDDQDYDLNQGLPLGDIPTFGIARRALSPLGSRSSTYDSAESSTRSDSDSDGDDDDGDEPSRPQEPLPPPQPEQSSSKRGRGTASTGRRGKGRRGGLAALLRASDPDAPSKRPRTSVRGRPRGSRATRPMRRKKADVEDADRRFGSVRKKRAGPDLSPEFKEKINQTMIAILEQRLDDAVTLAREAIQINPEVFAAHNMLSNTLEEMGRREEALKVLWAGAHTTRDASVWWDILRRHELAPLGNDEFANNEHRIYCYTQIIRLNRDDVEARKGRLRIFKSTFALGKAVREFENILRVTPYDLDLLRDYGEFCLKHPSYVPRVKTCWENAINHYYGIHEQATPDGINMTDLNRLMTMHLYTRDYKRGLEVLKRLARWLLGRKDERYWDEYQGGDTEWDPEGSRRRTMATHLQQAKVKYPPETYAQGLPTDLRVKLGMFRLFLGPENYNEALHHFRLALDGPTRHERPELVKEIADALFRSHHYSDALHFYKVLSKVQEQLLPETLLRMATAYRFDNNLAEAAKVLTVLLEVDSRSHAVQKEAAYVFDLLGDERAALEHASIALRLERNTATRHTVYRQSKPAPIEKLPQRPSDLGNTQASTASDVNTRQPFQSRKVKEIATMPTKQDVVSARAVGRRRAAADDPVTSQAHFMTREDAIDRFTILSKVTLGMRNGDAGARRLWLEQAVSLINNFVTMKLFYPFDRYIRFLGYDAESKRRAMNPNGPIEARDDLERLANKLTDRLVGAENETEGSRDQHSTVPDEYNGITFEQWCDIFCESACLYAMLDHVDMAYKILNSALNANVFYHDVEKRNQILTCQTAVAVWKRDEERLNKFARDWIKTYPHTTDTFRMYGALSSISAEEPNWYHCSTSQKFLFRFLKTMDYAVLSPEQREAFKFSHSERATLAGGAAAVRARENQDMEAVEHLANQHKLTVLDHVPLLLYGHILCQGGSHHNALDYYYRAHAVNPTNSMAHLSLACAYFATACKRKSGSRHFNIVQGFAFFDKYTELRLAEPTSSQRLYTQRVMETMFNRARIWSLLGLQHLALPIYEKVLALDVPPWDSPHSSDPDAMEIDELFDEPDFRREAALAVQQAMAASGDFERARKIAEQWLVY